MESGEIVAAAWALDGEVRARSDEIEAARRLPIDLVSRLASAGLMRMCVPAVYGGPEATPMEMMDAIATVAGADGAAGWCVMIASTTSSMSCFLPTDVAQRIYGESAVVTGGAFAPTGTAVAIDGGFRCSGRWAWGSGTQHCAWITGGCVVDNGEFRLMFFPADDVEIIDTWYSSGLRGTGSNDFVVNDVLVPTEFSVTPLALCPQIDAPLARFPNLALLAAGVEAATLGIAGRAIEEITALAGTKRPMMSARTLAQSAVVQTDVARAAGALGGATAFLHDAVSTAWDVVVAGDVVTLKQRAGIRLAATCAAQEAARATDLAYDAGGGSAVYSTSPLQRCFRDIHTATHHQLVSPRTFETVGRILLGQDADTSLF